MLKKSKGKKKSPKSRKTVGENKATPKSKPKNKITSRGMPADLKNFLMNGAKEKSAPRMERQTAKSYASIATHAWRAKGRIVDPDTGEPKEGLERIDRHIEGILQALEEDNVSIKDYEGGIFDTGMAVKPLAFDPTPGINREMVKETIRPTIIFNNQVLQLGEVIVGTPIEEIDNNEGEHDATDNN